MVVFEEGNLSNPQPPCYDMLVTWKAFNGRHTTTAQCAKGAEQKRRRLVEEGNRESMARALQAYGRLIESVTSLK